ncbi:MAG: thymidylate synthase [Candidatus Firestonebacteria bacterium]
MNGMIPVFIIEGKTIPEVWEKAVLLTWEKGIAISTEYDKKGDLPSRDCTMIMVVKEPFAEPRIHRAFPAGLEELEIYRQEVVDGVHDHWICPQEGKWTYTYHKRLFEYEIEGEKIDQIAYVIERLSKTFYSRRAQAITWNPKIDIPTDDPPCLQRCWFRILEDENKNLVLNMNTHWRSRDAYKAAFMNIFALTDLQKVVAEKISKKIGKKVLVGRYVDMCDSFHIYGSYYNEFKKFLETLKNRTFEERTWNSEFAEPFFEIGRQKLKEEKC